jgi:hypothetical protein
MKTWLSIDDDDECDDDYDGDADARFGLLEVICSACFKKPKNPVIVGGSNRIPLE